MRLSEIRGERALDALADLIDPVSIIAQDREIRLAIQNGNNNFAIKQGLKKHKKEVMQILAILDGEDVETYSPNILTVPTKLLEILNDPDLASLFQSQGQIMNTSSGSVTENTEADVQ